ncbi:hypothetical protein PQE75_gp015 [Bacillus phage vB_BcoS-136]|uniref:Uncharacterized protein n=1 Tax=Bacillus phage vB_BcoS-136 TaxID=2419619 RepID=A0A3G3BV88_9CAUD|nr:hypothetical protein PQE75_gp015 [Bacillus phage vB_BcoS-136]AYP68147.1 hypothetical protein vBBcoS136_00015 [Bacillus phage vB_BcoS-136]
MGKGLTGWLAPNGIFHACEYGEHYQLANELIWNNKELAREKVRISGEKGTVAHETDVLRELLWIPMGIPKWGSQENMDYLFISHLGRTDEQIKWFNENYNSLSETQQKMLEEHIDDFVFDNR